MRLDVKNSEGTLLARIAFDDTHAVQFLDEPDAEFAEFVQTALKRGITQKREMREPENDARLLLASPIDQSDPLFPLAFREFLEDNGYEVIEKHPEMEEEIKKLLAEYPDGEEKTDMLARLPDMSYLEQTAVLEGLRLAT